MVGTTLSHDAGFRAYANVALEGGSGNTITSECGNVIAPHGW